MKRRYQEEHANHERWAIPYADLLTLLLAFFVVMYAVSAVNVSKYRQMASSIHEAFNGGGKSIRPPLTQASASPGPVPAPTQTVIGAPQTPVETPVPHTEKHAEGGDKQTAALKDIAAQVRQAMQPLINRKLVGLHQTRFWLEIEIRTDLLFHSGQAHLQPSAIRILSQVAHVLSPFTNPLRVEGYTDNKPINTYAYPSNWELSAARAASVARLFSENGVDPSRLGILGWGQYRPIASNDTAEGRDRNRRVTIVVLSDKGAPARFYSDAKRIPSAADNQGRAASGKGAGDSKVTEEP
ncbi:flagellar motor protein MotD [Oleiagrimonas sp. C23AA]|uniref:flagellar motor protein MotD n=1 Tax=Oleiagrimonas sp. C23AA TaxID=2719047 RepID=UPI001422CB74|nr:flagellar motor protein MotD [Oleiagrimonas sp. C23AA]NII09172.1 flagellar motor protein MotD [Oleiagrimonas sp. C23AA]